MRVMTNVNTLLAARGTTFTNNFASYPLCCPSRSTYITGQYGHNHTIMGNAPPTGGYEKLAPTHSNTLPAWLRAAGYHTVHVGKYLNGYGPARPNSRRLGLCSSVDPDAASTTTRSTRTEGRQLRDGHRRLPDRRLRAEGRQPDRQAGRRPASVLPLGYLPRAARQRYARADIRRAGDPLLRRRAAERVRTQALPILQQGDVSDKPAGVRNRPLLTAGRINGIRGCISSVSSRCSRSTGVARIVNQLSAIGKLDQTYIIFTSDNGFFPASTACLGKVLLYSRRSACH
jgi:arylsulfatase A-like enzyme